MSISNVEQSIRDSLETYFKDLGDNKPSDIYHTVIDCVERAMFETVMHYANNNQVLAADYLKISRSTLRNKLRKYGLID